MKREVEIKVCVMRMWAEWKGREKYKEKQDKEKQDIGKESNNKTDKECKNKYRYHKSLKIFIETRAQE